MVFPCVTNAAVYCIVEQMHTNSNKTKKPKPIYSIQVLFGGDNKTRTCDLYDVNVAL